MAMNEFEYSMQLITILAGPGYRSRFNHSCVQQFLLLFCLNVGLNVLDCSYILFVRTGNCKKHETTIIFVTPQFRGISTYQSHSFCSFLFFWLLPRRHRAQSNEHIYPYNSNWARFWTVPGQSHHWFSVLLPVSELPTRKKKRIDTVDWDSVYCTNLLCIFFGYFLGPL